VRGVPKKGKGKRFLYFQVIIMYIMKTIYEKVEEKGLRIPIELCRLADISNEVVIKLYKGKIEICPQFILKEEAEKMANKYLITHVGDSLIAKDSVLINGKWKVSVIYSHTKKHAGELYLDAKTGAVLDSRIE